MHLILVSKMHRLKDGRVSQAAFAGVPHCQDSRDLNSKRHSGGTWGGIANSGLVDVNFPILQSIASIRETNLSPSWYLRPTLNREMRNSF